MGFQGFFKPFFLNFCVPFFKDQQTNNLGFLKEYIFRDQLNIFFKDQSEKVVNLTKKINVLEPKIEI